MPSVFSSRRHVLIMVWILSGFMLATQFNACSQVAFEQTLASKQVDIKAASLILINSGATYTADSLVELTLQNDKADEMYITNDPTCRTGGVWEPLAAKRPWTLGAKNQVSAAYVQYRDASEGIKSDCMKDDIIHDDGAPQVNLYDPDFYSRSSGATFQFVTTDAVSGVKQTTCKWPGQAEQVCEISSSRDPLAEGIYNISVKSEDKAGNVGEPVNQRVTVDRTPPEVTITEGPPAISGTKDVTLKFVATDNLSGVKFLRCSVNSTNNFMPCTSPLDLNLPEGAHYIQVQAEDKAGNLSAIKSHNFTIDLTAPVVKITSAPKDFTNSSSATFTYEGMDGTFVITVFQCNLDNAGFQPCDASGITYSNLAEGTHNFQVRGIDNVGNPSAPVAKNWTVDKTAPTAVIVSGPANPTNQTVANFSFNVNDDRSGVAGAQCLMDGATVDCSSMTSHSYSGVAAGSHNFKVIVKDNAGNIGESNLYPWFVDLGLPTIQLTETPGSFSNSPGDVFKFAAADAESGIARVDCRVDGAAFSACDSSTMDTVNNLTEGNHRFAVRARDNAGNLSTEAVHNWLVDRTAPTIAYFQQPPAAAMTGSNISLGFTATDAGSGLHTLECKLNGNIVACESGVALAFNNVASGHYEFVVNATDKAGNMISDVKTWDILMPVPKVQDISVSMNNKVDILVIIDNSGSMQSEQSNMSARFSNFLTKLAGLDWQLGIVTTDVSEDRRLKDGRLIAMEDSDNDPTDTYILSSIMNFTMANAFFSQTIQREEEGSGNERGFRAAKRALERSFSSSNTNAPNKALIRSGAILSMLIVSDAYDDVYQPEYLLDYVNTTWNNTKPFIFHSIVVPESQYTNPNGSSPDPNDPCKNYREKVKYDGRAYHKLSELTGGVKGTVCSEDYSAQLTAMGQATVDAVNASNLLCQPIDENRDGVVNEMDIRIQLESGANFTDFKLQGQKLTYTQPLPIGSHKVYYSCL